MSDEDKAQEGTPDEAPVITGQEPSKHDRRRKPTVGVQPQEAADIPEAGR